jgi:DNA invertase Pin-like site-specific DNA recombinase
VKTDASINRASEPKNATFPAAAALRSFCGNSRRNRRDNIRTARGSCTGTKPGASHPTTTPPPGTRLWICGCAEVLGPGMEHGDETTDPCARRPFVLPQIMTATGAVVVAHGQDLMQPRIASSHCCARFRLGILQRMLHDFRNVFATDPRGIMKTIGYARVSTAEQEAGLAAQIRELKALDCDRIFSEKISAKEDTCRAELERALDYLREGDGDVFVVTKLDRFARSLDEAIQLERRIAAKSASLKIIAMGIDTSTPTGRLMFNVLGSVAQFEREIMLERQREGIAAAKVQGKYRGRKPTVRAQATEIRRLKDEGLTNAEIARRLGVHRANVGRVLAIGQA